VGSCEHGKEPLGSIKLGNSLTEYFLASQEGLFSMALVTHCIDLQMDVSL
jgi:hypothetical protein